MKSLAVAVIVGVSLSLTVHAEDAAPAVAETTPALAPAPVAAPANQEETKDLIGRIEVRGQEGKEAVHILIERATGKRLVLPGGAKQLPAGFSWADHTGEVQIKALVITRERDGKVQVVVKRIVEVTPAPAAEPTATAPAAVEAKP